MHSRPGRPGHQFAHRQLAINSLFLPTTATSTVPFRRLPFFSYPFLCSTSHFQAPLPLPSPSGPFTTGPWAWATGRRRACWAFNCQAAGAVPTPPFHQIAARQAGRLPGSFAGLRALRYFPAHRRRCPGQRHASGNFRFQEYSTCRFAFAATRPHYPLRILAPAAAVRPASAFRRPAAGHSGLCFQPGPASTAPPASCTRRHRA